MFAEDKKNYYEILEIPPDASQSDIRQAYFRAKAAYGRDSAAIYSLFDTSETKYMLERIEEAYVVLSSSERRKEYDKTHGLLQNFEEVPSSRRPATAGQNRNTFSFSKNETSTAAGGDPAQQAAAAVFGADQIGGDASQAGNSRTANDSTETALGSRSADHSEYAVPRTLAASSAAGPPVEDYVSPARENRLGVVRRIDLLKTYKRDDEIEQAILDEKEFRGSFLKRIREYRAITIEELSDFTKISKTYLNCIEAEEFDSLPAPAYLRGFITQFAKAIKLPHDKAATGYMNYYQSVVGNAVK